MLDLVAGFGQLAVAAGLGGQVDDDGARPHRLDGRGGNQLRRRTAGHERRRDDDVEPVTDDASGHEQRVRVQKARHRSAVYGRPSAIQN